LRAATKAEEDELNVCSNSNRRSRRSRSGGKALLARELLTEETGAFRTYRLEEDEEDNEEGEE
jgi:hypothetical protein